MQARLLQQGPHSTAGIIHHQHLRRERKNIFHFTHDPIGSNHSHVAAYSIPCSAINIKYARQLRAARSNDLRRNRLRNKMLLEIKQRLQAASLSSILLHSGLLDAQLLILLAQLAVFPPQPANIEVVVPALAEPVPGGDKDPLNRGYDP